MVDLELAASRGLAGAAASAGSAIDRDSGPLPRRRRSKVNQQVFCLVFFKFKLLCSVLLLGSQLSGHFLSLICDWCHIKDIRA